MLAPIVFSNHWTIEKDTVLHKIALQCLISEGDDPKSKDYERFTDNGDLTLHVLYIDMCNANRKEINREQRKRLKL